MNFTDNGIVALIRINKDEAFTLLVKRYNEMVYWHVRRLVESFHDTEDVVQEAFLRIYKALGSFKSESSLKTWIYRIATNEALRFIDKRQRETGMLSMGLDNHPEATADEYVNYHDIAVVRFQQAIDTLPPKQRAVFNLRYYDELDYEEIASILNISPASAKSSYHVAKEKIKNLLTT